MGMAMRYYRRVQSIYISQNGLRTAMTTPPPDHSVDSDAQRIAALFEAAPAPVQQQVRSLLAPQNPATMRAGRVCLIGLRGAGVSTLGHMAGAALGVPFVELDKDIEQVADMPLTEILAFYGEAGYRRMEAEALEKVCAQHDQMIVAVPGGIVTAEQTYGRLLERFHSIWIRTSPAEHLSRVRAQNGTDQATTNSLAALEQLRTLLAIRTPLYAKAEVQVNTADRSPAASLADLLKVIEKNRFLDLG